MLLRMLLLVKGRHFHHGPIEKMLRVPCWQRSRENVALCVDNTINVVMFSTIIGSHITTQLCSKTKKRSGSVKYVGVVYVL